MSVISFLKIIAAMKRSRKLIKYKDHPGLNARMPNYSVKMGFGLHVGWSIEGAIGSFYKIDASYLSPNVNVAGRLEASTKMFGVPMLISGQIYDCFSKETQKHCREIDHVLFKGDNEPIRLFTADAEAANLEIDEDAKPMTRKEEKTARVKARLARDRFKTNIMQDEVQVSGLFETDVDLIEMRRPFSRAFFDLFA